MKIRRAVKKDKNRILELFNSDLNLRGDDNMGYKSNYIEEYLTNPVNMVFVAEENQSVVGVLLTEFWKKARYVYLNDLIIDKSYRNRGIATALIKHIEHLAKKNKIKLLFGFSEINNKKTHKLLNKLKYKKGKAFYFFSKGLR